MVFNFKMPHCAKCIFLVVSLFLGSCGYLSDKPPAGTELFRADQLQACKIDLDKLGEIFKQNQEAQINCLRDNFIQYTRYVKSKTNDSVNETELTDFIRKIFQNQSDSVVKGLSIIFQLNMILLKDEAQKISKGNITPLFQLLVTANREAIIITQALQDMSKAENQGRFFEIRDIFNRAISNFTDATLKIMANRTGKDQSLNIKKFLTDVSAKLGSKDIDQDTIESLLFLKQILVSGDKEIITTRELEIFFDKIPKVLSMSFDIYFSTNKNFATDAEQALFYTNDLKSLYSIVEFNQTDFNLISVDQILKLTKAFLKDKDKDLDVSKFKPSIVALKSRLLGGKSENFTLYDFKKCLDIAVDLFERIYFDNVTYAIRREFIEQNKPITEKDLTPINPDQYQIFSTRRIQELTKNFNQILINFKYYREKADGTPYYDANYKRTRFGFLETSILRFVSQKLLASYGRFSNGEMQVNIEDFQVFLDDMKPILEELKLWSNNISTFARNAILLADLFQHQSNGDIQMNERETAEYLQMILSSIKVSQDIRDGLSQYCNPGLNKADPLYEVQCFNDHFFDLYLNQLNYKKYFSRLFDYVNSVPTEESLNYLKGIEGFARDIDDPKIPINKRDSILILGAMINVETTFIRYDSNHDNVLDYNELMEAFKIYKDSVISLAKLKPGQESYAPSIFLYMVTKMEVPPDNNWLDNFKFYSYHKCVHNVFCRGKILDNIEAKRLNIGSLLYYLVNQGNTPPAKPIKKN